MLVAGDCWKVFFLHCVSDRGQEEEVVHMYACIFFVRLSIFFFF